MEKIIEAILMKNYQVMVTTESGLQGIFDVYTQRNCAKAGTPEALHGCVAEGAL